MANIENDNRAGLFWGERERKFFESLGHELIANVARQKIHYYQIDFDRTEVDDVYGEAIKKIVGRAIDLWGRVELVTPEIQTGRFTTDRTQTINVYLLRKYIYEEVGLNVRIGDYIAYDGKVFEITSMIDDVQTFGSEDFKLQILLKCTIARESDFVLPRS